MTKKQKKTVTTIGIISGAVILAGAALANYSTSNGYEVGKAAAIGLLENENYSSELSVKVLVDGEIIDNMERTEQYDRNGDVRYVYAQDNSDKDGWYSSYKGWYQDDLSIDQINHENQDVSTYVSSSSGPYVMPSTFDIFVNDSEEDKVKVNKYIRFGELLGDTLVGDLKNNVVYISGDDESSTYELSLNSVQVPEFVNAGLSALISTDEIEVGDYRISGEPYVSDFTLRFTVDGQGRLTDGLMTGELKATDDNGTPHTLNAEMSLKMYDYGTTQPQRVDIDTLENVKYNGSDDSVHTYRD